MWPAYVIQVYPQPQSTAVFFISYSKSFQAKWYRVPWRKWKILPRLRKVIFDQATISSWHTTCFLKISYMITKMLFKTKGFINSWHFKSLAWKEKISRLSIKIFVTSSTFLIEVISLSCWTCQFFSVLRFHSRKLATYIHNFQVFPNSGCNDATLAVVKPWFTYTSRKPDQSDKCFRLHLIRVVATLCLYPGFANWCRERFARGARIGQRHIVEKQDNGK